MILTPEVRALLKRMDADDAIDRAAQLGWNAAIDAAAKVCEERVAKWLEEYEKTLSSYAEGSADAAESCERNIRKLKNSK